MFFFIGTIICFGYVLEIQFIEKGIEAYGIGIKAPRKRNVQSKGKEPIQMNTTVRSVQLSLAIMLVLGVTTVNAQNNHFLAYNTVSFGKIGDKLLECYQYRDARDAKDAAIFRASAAWFSINQLLTNGKTIEVKTDLKWKNTGNLYIETVCWSHNNSEWYPSGISTTKAEYWAFVLEGTSAKAMYMYFSVAVDEFIFGLLYLILNPFDNQSMLLAFVGPPNKDESFS